MSRVGRRVSTPRRLSGWRDVDPSAIVTSFPALSSPNGGMFEWIAVR